MITSAGKGPCRFRLTCKGPQGNGSMPHDQNFLEALTESLNRALTRESELTVNPVVKEFFLNLAEDWQFLEPFQKSHRSEDLAYCLAKGGLMKLPDIRGMFENTISLNTMQAGEKAKVIPAKAEAQLDARLLPGQDPSSFRGKVNRQPGNTDRGNQPLSGNFLTHRHAGLPDPPGPLRSTIRRPR
ncbi:peptidase dimerization domain-containing protein [Dethiosulfatarculus sandiegensis]|nr:peptidase dimerization domain-containing protein [Dethiosulfatarculus sandiegensis]